MSETLLPKGWIATALKDICYLNPKNDLADDLDVGFLPMSGVPVNFGEKNIFEIKKWAEVKKGYTHFADGDTIFAKITPCFENSKASIIEKFPNGHGSGSTEYFVLRSVGRLVNPKLLLGLVRTNEFLREGAANMSGSVGHKRVPKEFVENYIFPLAPLAEQQQIAQKLDELLAQVDTLKTRLDAIPNILKRFRQSVLAAAVSGRLTEEWRGSDIKWPEKKLREICLSISDGDHQAPPRTDSGIPFLVISNVNKGFIDFSKVERWVPQYYFDELKDIRRPKRNDILYTVTGSFGIPVLVDTDQDFCFQRHIAILKPNANCLNYKFLFFLLGSSQAFKQADSVATGTAQRTVALNSLRDFEFGIPPLEEQTEIVRRVEQLFAYADQIEQRVKDAQARVNHLMQSILAKAFRGELTADWRVQNPELISGENSAAALLERIKAEREVAVKSKRKVKQ